MEQQPEKRENNEDGPDPAKATDVQDEDAWKKESVVRLTQEIGESVRVCILGGTKFDKPESEELVKALAEELTDSVGSQACFLTSGLPGVQRVFSENLGTAARIWHLLPDGEGSNFGVGTDVHVGKNPQQRKEVMDLLGEVYLTIEGGPAVSQELRSASSRAAFVVPIIRTGGASGGQYGVPVGLLQKPGFASAETWGLLSDAQAPIRDSAKAAATIAAEFVKLKAESRSLKSAQHFTAADSDFTPQAAASIQSEQGTPQQTGAAESDSQHQTTITSTEKETLVAAEASPPQEDAKTPSQSEKDLMAAEASPSQETPQLTRTLSAAEASPSQEDATTSLLPEETLMATEASLSQGDTKTLPQPEETLVAAEASPSQGDAKPLAQPEKNLVTAEASLPQEDTKTPLQPEESLVAVEASPSPQETKTPSPPEETLLVSKSHEESVKGLQSQEQVEAKAPMQAQATMLICSSPEEGAKVSPSQEEVTRALPSEAALGASRLIESGEPEVMLQPKVGTDAKPAASQEQFEDAVGFSDEKLRAIGVIDGDHLDIARALSQQEIGHPGKTQPEPLVPIPLLATTAERVTLQSSSDHMQTSAERANKSEQISEQSSFDETAALTRPLLAPPPVTDASLAKAIARKAQDSTRVPNRLGPKGYQTVSTNEAEPSRLVGAGVSVAPAPKQEISSASHRLRRQMSARWSCGPRRLKLRQDFNHEEINVMRVMQDYDKDGSETLEQDELRNLLHDWSSGADISDDDIRFILAVADFDHDNCISSGEVMYALRAWYSYKHLPSNVESILNEHGVGEGILTADDKEFQDSLCQALTFLNEHQPVDQEEVAAVIDIMKALSPYEDKMPKDVIYRAVATWYLNIERDETQNSRIAANAFHKARTAVESVHETFMRGRAALQVDGQGQNAQETDRAATGFLTAAIVVCAGYISGFVYLIWIICVATAHPEIPGCPAPLSWCVYWAGVINLIQQATTCCEGSLQRSEREHFCQQVRCCVSVPAIALWLYGAMSVIRSSSYECGAMIWNVALFHFIIAPLLGICIIPIIMCCVFGAAFAVHARGSLECDRMVQQAQGTV